MAQAVKNVVVKYTYQSDVKGLEVANKTIGNLNKTEQDLIKVHGELSKKSKKAFTDIADSSKKVEGSINKVSDSFSALSSLVTQGISPASIIDLGKNFLKLNDNVDNSAKKFLNLKTVIAGLGLTSLAVAIGSVTTAIKNSETASDSWDRTLKKLSYSTTGLTGWFKQLGQDLVVGFEKISNFFSGNALEIDRAVNALDAITEKTQDTQIATSKLTTEIDVQLKALRNKNNTYKENEDIINRIYELDKQRLNLNRELNAAEFEAQKLALINLNQKTKLNEQFISDTLEGFKAGEISYEQIVSDLGDFTTEQNLRVFSELIKTAENYNRETLVLEERLNNFREANFNKEVERINSINQKRINAAQSLFDIEYRIEVASLNRTDKLKEIRISGYQSMQDELIKANERYKAFTGKNNDELLSKWQDLQVKKLEAEKDYLKKIEEEEKKRYEKKRANEKRQMDERISDLKKELDMRISEQEAADRRRERAEEEAELRREYRTRTIQETTFQLATDISSALFEMEKEKYNQSINLLEKKRQYEIDNAGDSAEKRKAIEQKYDIERRRLQNEQARAAKNAVIFEIGLQTILNAVKALGTPPIVPNYLAFGTTKAVGGVQLAIALSKPVPKFYHGTEKVERGNNPFGIDTIPALLHEGERVVPSYVNEKLKGISNLKLPEYVTLGMNFKKLLEANKINASNNTLEKKLDMINENLRRLNVTSVSIDKKGFEVYIENSLSKKIILNNRYCVGIQVR